MIDVAVPLDPTGHLPYFYTTKTESKELYLIHRNNHREAAKRRR